MSSKTGGPTTSGVPISQMNNQMMQGGQVSQHQQMSNNDMNQVSSIILLVHVLKPFSIF